MKFFAILSLGFVLGLSISSLLDLSSSHGTSVMIIDLDVGDQARETVWSAAFYASPWGGDRQNLFRCLGISTML